MSLLDHWTRTRPKRSEPVPVPDLCFDVLEAREAKGLDYTSSDDDGADGELPCPWCGDTRGDLHEMDRDTYACSTCGGEYEIERECSLTVTATRGEKLPEFLCREALGADCEDGTDDVGDFLELVETLPCDDLAPTLAAAACAPALGPAAAVCAGAFFQPQPAPVPQWNGAPAPATWEAFAWPAWVPEKVRAHIEGRSRWGREGSPAQWLARSEAFGLPALGAWLTLPRERPTRSEPPSHAVLDAITGRFVPSPDNGDSAGYLVFRDGRALLCWSVPRAPRPWIQEQGFRYHLPR